MRSQNLIYTGRYSGKPIALLMVLMKQLSSGRWLRLVIVVLGVISVSTLCILLLRPKSAGRTEGSTIAGNPVVPTFLDVPDDFYVSQPVYPHSVVPGGIHNLKALQEVVRRDPVASQHYSALRLKKMRFVTAPKARYAFVSYRLNNQVFWTSRRVHIPKGEVLMSDGSEWLRSRCGNRLSDTPRKPTSPSEPPVAILDTPEKPFVPLLPSQFDPAPFTESGVPGTPIANSPPSTPILPGGTYIPPVIVLPPYLPGSDTDPPADPADPTDPPADTPPTAPPEHPTAVPEPGSLILLASGLAAGFSWLRWKRKT